MTPPERAPAVRPVTAAPLDAPSGRVAVRLAVRPVLRRRVAALPGAPPGVAGPEGQRPRRHRRRPEEPRPRDRGRVAVRDRQQPVLRPVERSHDLTPGHAAPVDGRRAGRRRHRHPHRRPRTDHRGGSRRLVHRPGLPQRPPRRPGRDPARPGAHRTARPGLRDPRGLPPRGVGGGHLPGPGLRRRPADDVPGPAPRRRRPGRHVHRLPRRPAARPGQQAALVAAAARRVLLRQPTGQPRLRLGLRQPVPAGHGLRLPRHVPGVLPHRPDRRPGEATSHTRSTSARWSSPSPSSSRHRWPAGSRTGSADGRSSSPSPQSPTPWRWR